MDACILSWRHKLAALLLAATASLSLVLAEASHGEENQRFSYGLQGNNAIFTDWDEATSGALFRFSLSGGSEATVVVELVDIYADDSGFRKPLPLNSTPYTANGLVTFPQDFEQYVPNGQTQYFEVPFKFKKGDPVDRPVIAGIKLSLATPGSDQEELEVKSSVVATFAYYPGGSASALGLTPKLELEEMVISRDSADLFPFNLIPDFPFLYNGVPEQVSYLLRNSGNIFLETSTQVEVNRLNLFGVVQSEDSYVSSSAEALLIPNQSTQGTLKISNGQGQQDGASIGFGLFQIVVSSNGSLGSDIETTTSKSQLLLIFPWKYLSLLLVAAVLLRKRIRALIRWLIDYAKAIQEFRRSSQQQDQIARVRRPGYLSSSSSKNIQSASNSSGTEPRPLYPTWYEPPGRSRDHK